MASETITLRAESKYGYSGQYIARIVGRDPKVTFSREFVGSKYGKRNECSSFETDETGLFEICDVGKSGKSKEFKLVLPWRDGLVSLTSDSSDALKIAKRLSEGEHLTDFVVAEPGEELTQTEWYAVCSVCNRELSTGEECADHPEGHRVSLSRQVPRLKEDGTPLRRLVYVIRSKNETKKADAATTLDSAVEAIVAALQALPASRQKRALALAKAKLFPKDESITPKRAREVGAEDGKSAVYDVFNEQGIEAVRRCQSSESRVDWDEPAMNAKAFELAFGVAHHDRSCDDARTAYYSAYRESANALANKLIRDHGES